MKERVRWLKDATGREVIGLGTDGFIYFHQPECRTGWTAVDEEWLNRAFEDLPRLKSELESAQRQINAREPVKWVEEAAKELEARGNEASTLKSDSAAGKIMWGQAQAYRDAAALIRSYVKP